MENKNQALTIDDDGSVGVGTTSPQAHVTTSGNSTVEKYLILIELE